MERDNSYTKGYETGRRDGAREAVENTIDDLFAGLDALDGDIKEAEIEKFNYFLGYRRALHFAIGHVQKIAADLGVPVLTTKE